MSASLTARTPLPPLETLCEGEQGTALPLPPDLMALYGRLSFPLTRSRPYLVGNMAAITCFYAIASPLEDEKEVSTDVQSLT